MLLQSNHLHIHLTSHIHRDRQHSSDRVRDMRQSTIPHSHFAINFCSFILVFHVFLGSVHPMVTVTPSPLAGPALQPPPRRSAESSPSHSHTHSHSQMSRNSSRKSNNSVNCKIDGKHVFEFMHEPRVCACVCSIVVSSHVPELLFFAPF